MLGGNKVVLPMVVLCWDHGTPCHEGSYSTRLLKGSIRGVGAELMDVPHLISFQTLSRVDRKLSHCSHALPQKQTWMNTSCRLKNARDSSRRS